MQNYFDYFDLPIHISLDSKVLRKKFLVRSRSLHPDFHTLSSVDDQKDNLAASSLNNEAYLTLSDPLKRIDHLLRLHGKLDGSEKMSGEYLMEMMELNELLMEAKMGDNSAKQKVEEKLTEKIEQEEKTMARLAETFNSEDESQLMALEQWYLRQKYIKRLEDQLTEK